MGRPAVSGRQVLFDKYGRMIGLCLGFGGYCEHVCDGVDEMKTFVGKFNTTDEICLSLCKLESTEEVRRRYKALKKGKQILKRLEKRHKGTSYESYAPFVLNPGINTYTRKLIIDNSEMDEKYKRALWDGKYNYLALEGGIEMGVAKNIKFARLGNRRKFSENELVCVSDYNCSFFTKKGEVLSNWGYPWANIELYLSAEDKGLVKIHEDIQRTLENGYLALLNGKVFGLSDSLCLVFLDRLCFNKDIGGNRFV